MRYKEIVRQIRDLRWERAKVEDLMSLMVLSAYAATEFAASLRIALVDHPMSKAFQLTAAGELNADNLRFADYSKSGDHADFLWHFILKYKTHQKCSKNVSNTGACYIRSVKMLDRTIRVMSIVSREQETPGIFTSILKARGWDEQPELQAFKYYLEQHIALDSGEGGHADLLSGFEVNDLVVPFYEHRLRMYHAIPVLFA